MPRLDSGARVDQGAGDEGNFTSSPYGLAMLSGPILAVALMGIGMIAAAITGRLRAGVVLALLAGAGLVLAARLLGMALPHPFSTALALIIASFSFAARGALFARAYPGRGWMIALFVVGGEAAMLATATTMPGVLPTWLLALLPAQWASTGIATALFGTGTRAAAAQLLALAGTGAVTLLVARLLPRRWPYALMFTAWLGLSALVWHAPPAGPHPDAGSARQSAAWSPAAIG
jgi:hypothetical protein